MNGANVPEQILRAVEIRFPVQRCLSAAPGLSGGRVWRVDSLGGESFALKRWPPGTSTSRVEEVHRTIDRIRANGLELLPKYWPLGESTASTDPLGLTVSFDTFREDHEGCVWELADWQPGQPIAQDAGLDVIALGAETIGRFHAASRRIGCWQQPCLAVASRRARLAELSSEIEPALSRPTFSLATHSLQVVVEAAVNWLRLHWSARSRAVADSLARFSSLPVTTHWVLRDVHREHVLFTQPDGTTLQPSAIIDFDAIRIDSPATDLARWVTSFSTCHRDRERAFEAVLAGHRRGSAFQCGGGDSLETSEFLALFSVLVETTPVLSLANWVVWLVVENRRFSDFHAVADRIEQLLRLVSHSPGRSA